MPQSEANLGKGRKELLLSENLDPELSRAAVFAAEAAFSVVQESPNPLETLEIPVFPESNFPL